MVLAEARLLGRAKEGWGLSDWRVGVAVGGGMVKDWQVALGWTDAVLVLVWLACVCVGSGREPAPWIVLPLARLRLLRTVTVAGM